jgi:hypothetical protein
MGLAEGLRRCPVHPKVNGLVVPQTEVFEILEVLVLAIAAIATVWSGHQAARGDGAQAGLETNVAAPETADAGIAPIG